VGATIRILSLGVGCALATPFFNVLPADVATAQSLKKYEIVIINDTNSIVIGFNAKAISSNSWSWNLLGSNLALVRGQKHKLTIDDGQDHCSYDFKATLASGTTIQGKNINVCTTNVWTVKSSAPGDQPQDRHVDIKNGSSANIVRFFATKTGTTNWSWDLLGSGVEVTPGRTFRVNIDDGTNACNFDLKAELSDKTTLQKGNVNVCVLSEWTVN